MPIWDERTDYARRVGRLVYAVGQVAMVNALVNLCGLRRLEGQSKGSRVARLARMANLRQDRYSIW